MDETARMMLQKLREALPDAKVFWEIEPVAGNLKGSALSAEHKDRKFTIHFDSKSEGEAAEGPDDLVEQVVDDFVEFFSRSIYRKEKFTRLI